MTLNWVNFDYFICQTDPYSGLKIDPEFRVKYVDPGLPGQFNPACVGGILTRIRVAI